MATSRYDRADIVRRYTAAVDAAVLATGTARDLRAWSRTYRTGLAARRYATMTAIRQARRLRYERYSPILAVFTGEDPTDDEAFLAASQVLVNRLFGVSLTLSGALATLDGSGRQQALDAIEKIDGFIKAIRQTAFDRAKAARPPTVLDGIREATASLDALLETSPNTPDLLTATHLAHQAFLTLTANCDT